MRVAILIQILKFVICIDEEVVKTFTPKVKGSETTVDPSLSTSYLATIFSKQDANISRWIVNYSERLAIISKRNASIGEQIEIISEQNAIISELNATISKQKAKMELGYVLACSAQFRYSEAWYFEKRYMTSKYMNTHPEYKKLREELFHRKFVSNYPNFRDVNRTCDAYKTAFTNTYGKPLVSSQLTMYERLVLFVKWLLMADEWRTIRDVEKGNMMWNQINELKVFYNAIQNYTTIEFTPSNYEEIAHLFASLWSWLKEYLHHTNYVAYTDRSLGAGYHGSIVAKNARNYLMIFSEFSEHPPSYLQFCAKFFMELLDRNPSTATSPAETTLVWPWPSTTPTSPDRST